MAVNTAAADLTGYGMRELEAKTVWELTPHQLRDAQRFLDAISERWDEALARLRSSVEDDDPV